MATANTPTTAKAVSPQAGAGPKTSAQVRTGLITMVMAILQTTLIAWFGFALSGRLELVLKERSMAIQSANALAVLVSEMQDPGKDATTQAAQIRKIAMYGREASEPLTMMAAATGPYAERLPLNGLRLVAIHHKPEVCRAVKDAIAAEPLIDPVRFASIKEFQGVLKCD